MTACYVGGWNNRQATAVLCAWFAQGTASFFLFLTSVRQSPKRPEPIPKIHNGSAPREAADETPANASESTYRKRKVTPTALSISSPESGRSLPRLPWPVAARCRSDGLVLQLVQPGINRPRR